MRSSGLALVGVISAVVRLRSASGGVGVKFVEDPFDPILTLYRFVVDEPELRCVLQTEPRADLTTEKCRGPAECPAARLASFGIAEHSVHDTGDMEIGTHLDSRQGDKPYPWIVYFPCQQGGEL